MEGLTKKVPGFGSAMQIFDVPMMMKSEMEAEVDKAVANKKKASIGTVWNILNEEGMDEVAREQHNGTYDWSAVFYRTAVRSTGEISQLNAIMRYGNNLKYDVHDLEKQARLEQEKLRNKLAAKTVASDRNLEAIRRRTDRGRDDLSEEGTYLNNVPHGKVTQYHKGVKTGKETGRRYCQYGKTVTADQFRKGAGAFSLSLDGRPYWNRAVPQKAVAHQQGNRISYTLEWQGDRLSHDGQGHGIDRDRGTVAAFPQPVVRAILYRRQAAAREQLRALAAGRSHPAAAQGLSDGHPAATTEIDECVGWALCDRVRSFWYH
jgi:hypothetical protein